MTAGGRRLYVGTPLRRMVAQVFKVWELLRPVLATKVPRKDKEFAGEVFIKSGSLANRRAEFVDGLTNVSEHRHLDD